MFPLLLLLACPHTPAGRPTDPPVVLARSQTPAPDNAVVCRFDMNAVTPTVRGPASGTLLVDPPDRFYLEIRPPVGGPLFVATSDGKAVNAWIAGKNVFYTHPDADVGLKAVTGGVVGLQAVVSLLTGRLPMLGNPATLAEGPGTVDGEWLGPGGTRLKVSMDPGRGRMVRMIGLDSNGTIAVDAEMTPGMVYPTDLNVNIPRIGTSVEINFKDWRPIQVLDARYSMIIPAGAQVVLLDAAQLSGEKPEEQPAAPPALEGPQTPGMPSTPEGQSAPQP